MGRNRMQDYDAWHEQHPNPPASPIPVQHFVTCPQACWSGLSLVQLQAMQALYAAALAEALAVARPSRVERDLLGFWN